jgi:hypothetical protein
MWSCIGEGEHTPAASRCRQNAEQDIQRRGKQSVFGDVDDLDRVRLIFVRLCMTGQAADEVSPRDVAGWTEVTP